MSYLETLISVELIGWIKNIHAQGLVINADRQVAVFCQLMHR